MAAGYARNTSQADQFLAELKTNGRDGVNYSVHKGDVASAEDCRRTIDEVIAEHGRIDILINNAGITIDRTVLKMEDDDWDKVISVNLSGAFYLAQAALRHMLERGTGRIVNVSSVIGETGNIGQANYAASKAGLFGLTKTLAKEATFTWQGRPSHPGQHRCHRQHGHPGIRRHGNGGIHSGEGAGPYHRQHSREAPCGSPGDCSRRPLPRSRCLVVHHRSGVGCQRRARHVTAHPHSSHIH